MHAVTRASGEAIEMSVTSVYNKLQQMEPGTSAALMGWSAQRATELIEEVSGQWASLVAGFTDGNALDGREHLLKESCGCSAAPLPGKVVAVLPSSTLCRPPTQPNPIRIKDLAWFAADFCSLNP